jgi:hypothetical protein
MRSVLAKESHAVLLAAVLAVDGCPARAEGGFSAETEHEVDNIFSDPARHGAELHLASRVNIPIGVH